MKKFEKLVKSIKKGQLDKASQILQQATLNINELDSKSGKSLLQLTIENNDSDMFNLLLTYPGINIEQQSKQGEFPLETAILLNNPYFVNKLLQTGNINQKKKNANHQTALQIAIMNQTSKQILKKLIQFKFDPYNNFVRDGSLINLSIMSKQIQNFLFLLDLIRQQKGSQTKQLIKLFTVTDQHDNNCLILAVQQNLGDAVSAILQYLNQEGCVLNTLQKQFFINSQNKQGNTALHIACYKDNQTIISLLESHFEKLGYDFNIKNKKTHTPASIKQSHVELLQKQKENKLKSIQEKKIYLKQKQIQKKRKRQEQQRMKIQEKKRIKQEQLLEMKKIQYDNQERKKKTLFGCGIFVVLLVGIMYLVMVNTINQKKVDQF